MKSIGFYKKRESDLATRVVGDLPAAVIREVNSVDVYKTNAKLIIFVNLEARWLGTGSLAL